LSLGQATELHQRLDDPERADDEAGLRCAEIVLSQIAIEEPFFLTTIARRLNTRKCLNWATLLEVITQLRHHSSVALET
jgi:hypothetical protein